MKKITIIIVTVLVLVGGFYWLGSPRSGDYKNAEYVVEGQKVKLGSGTAKYFGNELKTDLDSDGLEDVVFLITDQPGGSGTFYYVVAARNTPSGYVGGQALFLGDRIAPQTTEKGKGKIVVVNYADRARGEPFSTPPSVGKSIWLLLDPTSMQFGEVVQDFEGEADPSKMTLGMKKWVWTNDSKFTLTFGTDGRFSATTDCNSMSGKYNSNAGKITFSEIASTEMYCAGSKESDFSTILTNAKSYRFTSRGELLLDLPTGQSSTFR